MKKHFEKIRQALSERMMLIEGFCKPSKNPEIIKYLKKTGRDPETEIMLRKIVLAETYLIRQEVKSLIFRFERIYERCVSELNGTYYKDFVKEYENFEGFEYNPQKHNVYTYISEMIEEKSLEISNELIEFISENAQFQLTLTNGLYKHFPVLEKCTIATTTDGEMVPVTKDEVLQNQFTRDYATQTNIIEGYPVFLSNLSFLAKNNGNLAEIIRMVE